MRKYKNPAVQIRVTDDDWMNAFWCWLADGWGWKHSPTPVAAIIAQANDCPYNIYGRQFVSSAFAPEIIRAAISVMCESEYWGIVKVGRGEFRFTE